MSKNITTHFKHKYKYSNAEYIRSWVIGEHLTNQQTKLIPQTRISFQKVLA
jgi:hypothetical protein